MKGSIEYYWSDWKVVREIGKGAYGSVYEVEKEDFGTTVKSAIKVISIPQNRNETQVLISEGSTDKEVEDYYEDFVKKLLSEFTIMAELRGNSNIVSYEDHKIVKHPDAPGYDIFIKMELLNSFYTFFRDREVTVEDVLKIGIDICSALEICEKKKIIHRDIKPDNIFYNDLGVFKLGDFGVARQLESLTSNLSRIGTYNYMAPEIYLNKEYDSTVDIYSLGVVLYKCLNGGRVPFMSKSDALTSSAREAAFSRRLSGERFPIPEGCDEELANVVIKACAYDPRERYQTAAEFRQELVRISNELVQKKYAEEKPQVTMLAEFELTERDPSLADIRVEGSMMVLTGSMMGTRKKMISMQPMMVGRDVRLCDFVIPDSYMGVSRTHCTIYYNGYENMYYVKDGSTNGTWTSPVNRLEKGKFVRVSPGTVLLLGNFDCSIELS